MFTSCTHGCWLMCVCSARLQIQYGAFRSVLDFRFLGTLLLRFGLVCPSTLISNFVFSSSSTTLKLLSTTTPNRINFIWYELVCLHSFVMFVLKQRFVVLYLHNDQMFCCKIVNYLSFYSENGFPLRTHNWIWTMFNWCQIIQMQWTTNQSNTNKKEHLRPDERDSDRERARHI